MPRYMVQLATTPDDYIRALDKYDPDAIDFLPQVYWGEMQNRNVGWAIVDAPNEQAALSVIPEQLRSRAEVCEIHTYSPELIQAVQNKTIEKAA